MCVQWLVIGDYCLMHPSTEIKLINLLNKSYKSNLRLDSKLNGKITKPLLMTLCVMKIILKR
jgi:hypothetical protein